MAERTSAEWLKELNNELDARQEELRLYEDYYEGRHRLHFAGKKWRKTFGAMFEKIAINFCQLVVDAEAERLRVDGFRTNPQGSNESQADQDAWNMWQANRLDARSALVHREALIEGTGYVVVWNNPAKPGIPLIRPLPALQTVCYHDDGDEDRRLAAMRRWMVEDYEYATLYLPDRIEKYRSREKIQNGGVSERDDNYWVQRTVPGEDWPLANPLGIVPVVPFYNAPTLLDVGRSELRSVIPIQDAINKVVSDMLVASEFVAFPQRWATGIEVPVDEATGRPLNPFIAGPGQLWIADIVQGADQTVTPQFGQFSAADLAPYVKSIEMLVQHLASITKTPPHYLLGQMGQFPSGEALSATEAGLVAKSEAAQLTFGESWEESLGLGFSVVGQNRDTTASETRWAPAERRAPAQYADALGKQRQMLEVPIQMTWEQAGYSQTEITRMMQLRATEKLAASVTEVITPEQAQTISTLVDAGFDPAAVVAALKLPPLKFIGKPEPPAAPFPPGGPPEAGPPQPPPRQLPRVQVVGR